MSTTVYTYNDKVLVNSANDKWLKKKETPVIEEITIGNQIWMAKNLAIDDGGEGISTRELTNVNGYNLGTQYYYTEAAAERIANSIQGWHLPTKAEVDTMTRYIYSSAGLKLKSTYAWSDYNGNSGNGTDIYGFCGLPVSNDPPGTYQPVGQYAYFWTSTLYNDTEYYYFQLQYAANTLALGSWDPSTKLSVRLIKD